MLDTIAENRTHIDLFSGIGGFSLSARWVGWKTVLFSEKDKFCQKVLKKNFGDVPLIEDIKDVSAKSIRELGITERPFALTAGFPCQPFSQAGQRKGTNDERFLWDETLKTIKSVQPCWFVGENVAGLASLGKQLGRIKVESRIETGLLGSLSGSGITISTKRLRILATIIQSLYDAGYQLPETINGLPIVLCIPACAVGAPHRRDRLWIIANAVQPRPSSVKREIFTRQSDQKQAADSTRSSDCGIIANSNDERCFGRREQSQNEERQIFKGCGNDRAFGEPAIGNSVIAADASDSDQSGWQESCEPFAVKTRFAGTGVGYWSESWHDVALRTCVRGMDARFSDKLDIVGSRDNRTNRLKSLGNSIVPQIAFEIFKAIDSTIGASIPR